MKSAAWLIVLIGLILVSEVGFALYMEYQAEKGPTVTFGPMPDRG